MRLSGGRAYIYSYRINIPQNPNQRMWCLNLTSGKAGFGSAVLIGALEPICGMEIMRGRRLDGVRAAGSKGQALIDGGYFRDLCSGPAKLCEALSITDNLDGTSVFEPPFELYARLGAPRILCGPRVGVKKGVNLSRRYVLEESIFISSRNRYPLWRAPCPREQNSARS